LTSVVPAVVVVTVSPSGFTYAVRSVTWPARVVIASAHVSASTASAKLGGSLLGEVVAHVGVVGGYRLGEDSGETWRVARQHGRWCGAGGR
jgi:hypothetical protein